MFNPDTIAICEKCGREFLTLPNDGRDPYDRRSGYRGNRTRRLSEEFDVCGGNVLSIEKLAENNEIG